MNITFEPVSGEEVGVVAFVRMPLKLGAMEAMNTFIEQAYGNDCVCDEKPKGWLRIQRNPTDPKKE